MKVLSIEEKAQRYDEAIERLRNAFYGNNSRMCEEYRNAALKIIKPIFPELKESEDERIRKDIISHFAKGIEGSSFDEVREKYKIWIAWLEKQGDQKPANTEKGAKGNEREIPFTEQKPADKVEPKFKVGDEIKTSNEESLTITKIDEKGYWSGDLFICGFDDADKWELVEQKPAWSEEDERFLNVAINILNSSKVYTTSTDKYEDTINWLKSIKDRVQPHNRWKPSDEQMYWLKNAIDSLDTISVRPSRQNLESLYNDLKKLREE